MGTNILDIADFKGGLNTRDADHRIADDEATILLNLVPVKDGGLEKRAGSAKYNSSVIEADKPVHSLFRYYKSAAVFKEMLACCDDGLYKGNDSTGVWTEIGSSALSVDDDCSFAIWQDICYIFNGTVQKQYNGTNLTNVAGTPPAGRYVVFRKDRLYVAGVDANPNILYYCETGDPTTWNTGSNFIQIRSNDGDKITGILPLGDNLVIYKNNSVWLLAGTSDSDFFLTQVSQNIGCMAPKTLIGDKQLHYFLHRMGVYAFNGADTVKISSKIDPTVNTSPTHLVNAAATLYNERYWLSFTESGQTENLKVLVFDTRHGFGGWSLFEGLAIKSFALWDGAADEGQLYAGDSGTGFVWQLNTGADDGGSSIESAYQSKNFTLGNSVVYKTVDYAHVAAENSSVILNVTVSGDHGQSLSLPLGYSLQGAGVSLWDVAIFDIDIFSSAAINTFQKSVNAVIGRGMSIAFQETGQAAYTISGLGFEYSINNINDRVLS